MKKAPSNLYRGLQMVVWSHENLSDDNYYFRIKAVEQVVIEKVVLVG